MYCDRWENTLPTLKPEFDLVLTDPPYNAINRKTQGLRTIDKGIADSEPVNIELFGEEIVRLCNGSFYIWCGDEQYSSWCNEFTKRNLTTRKCAWHKSNPSPMNGDRLWLSALELCVFSRKPKAYFNGHCEHPLWTGPVQRGVNHPTPKPVWLMENLIYASCPERGYVLDPFGGGGSTAVAAKKLNRKCVIVEMSEEYCEEIVRRLK